MKTLLNPPEKMATPALAGQGSESWLLVSPQGRNPILFRWIQQARPGPFDLPGGVAVGVELMQGASAWSIGCDKCNVAGVVWRLRCPANLATLWNMMRERS